MKKKTPAQNLWSNKKLSHVLADLIALAGDAEEVGTTSNAASIENIMDVAIDKLLSLRIMSSTYQHERREQRSPLCIRCLRCRAVLAVWKFHALDLIVNWGTFMKLRDSTTLK